MFSEGEDRRVGRDSRLDLDALVRLAAHEGVTVVWPRRGGAGLVLKVSCRAARLIAKYLTSTDGVGLPDVLCVWARRASEGCPTLVYVAARAVATESLVIDLEDDQFVRVRREDEVG